MEGVEVHRLYYVTKSEIKKELKELFGSDLSWIPDHLFFEREYVPCYTDEERHHSICFRLNRYRKRKLIAS